MHWYYSREDTDLRTPSRASGIDYDTEMRYRKEGARFIMDLGNKLGLRYLTMATGIVFFHRFYMIQSFKNFPRWVTGTACLFLAGKVEETPKKCKDVLRVAKGLLSSSQLECFGEDPRRMQELERAALPWEASDMKVDMEEEVMMYERILLQTIKFDLQVDHPYQYLIKFCKGLKGDKEKLNEMVQKAWIFINDSLSTCICLHYKPPVVALAMLQLAAKLVNQNMQSFAPVPRQDWWRHFDPEVEQTDLDSICEEMMSMYEPSRRRGKSKDSSSTSSPASVTNSPNVSMSPPSKKKTEKLRSTNRFRDTYKEGHCSKRLISSSSIDGSKAKDSPLAKPQVENVTPPNKAAVKDLSRGALKDPSKAKVFVSSAPSSRPTTPSVSLTQTSVAMIPQASVVSQDQHNYYFQHGFKFAGINTNTGEISQQPSQQYQQSLMQLPTASLQQLQNPPAFNASVIQYDNPLLSRAQLSTGYVDQTGFIDQTNYAYVTSQQPQQQPTPLMQQPSQVITNWQNPQPGTGSGWMK